MLAKRAALANQCELIFSLDAAHRMNFHCLDKGKSAIQAKK
jgi:hypothetical protein